MAATPLGSIHPALAEPGLVAEVRVMLGPAVPGLEVLLAPPGSPVPPEQAGPALARPELLLPQAGPVPELVLAEVAPLSGV